MHSNSIGFQEFLFKYWLFVTILLTQSHHKIIIINAKMYYYFYYYYSCYSILPSIPWLLFVIYCIHFCIYPLLLMIVNNCQLNLVPSAIINYHSLFFLSLIYFLLPFQYHWYYFPIDVLVCLLLFPVSW
jgi:hypothetical protein